MKHKVAIGNISAIVSDFIDQVLMPEAQKAGEMIPFTVGVVSGYVLRNVDGMVNQHINVAKTLGVVDAENMIDVDMAYEVLSDALSKSPLIIASYKFAQDDLDTLHNIMLKYAVTSN